LLTIIAQHRAIATIGVAISATGIFARHPESLDAATAAMIRAGRDPFHLPHLRFTREAAESMAINEVRSGAIILAGSGMRTGGRVRHHLRHNLGRPECSVLFVGYAAGGTLARLIIDGARHVRLFDQDVPVRARIHTIHGFSAHADQEELLAWHAQVRGTTATFLVHGEEPAMRRWPSGCPARAPSCPG
jgi:metallo-beta-lactamase family protein